MLTVCRHDTISEVVGIIQKFLDVKRAVGSNREKQFYKGMTIESFLTRLATKRALVFYLASDETLLRDGNRYRDWAKVGTDHEVHLQLTDYMSYDELLISALYAVACPTFFINNGERRNCAKLADPGTYEPEGVFVGLVGARFEHADKMESSLLIITPSCTESNGFGAKGDLSKPQAKLLNIWAPTYGVEHKGNFYLPSWNEVVAEVKSQKAVDGSRWKGLKYMKIADDRYLNVQAYKKRMRITIETFLFAAEKYARDAKRAAYCHVIGLGLGAWGISTFQVEQAEMILAAYIEALTEWSFPSISDIDFSWFPGEVDNIAGIYSGEVLSVGGNNINVHISKRNPSDPLNDPGKLLIAQYAWDGNSYPGNEYWLGAQFLGLSSDPAAACCSMIPQLQNPLINPSFVARPPIVVGANADAVFSVAWKKPSLTSTSGLNLVPEPMIIPGSPPISDDEYLSFVDDEASVKRSREKGKDMGFLDNIKPPNNPKSKDVTSSTTESEEEPEKPRPVSPPKETANKQPKAAAVPEPQPHVVAEHDPEIEAGSVSHEQPEQKPQTAAAPIAPGSLQELQAKMEAEMQAKLAAMQAQMEREMQARLSKLLTQPGSPTQPFPGMPFNGQFPPQYATGTMGGPMAGQMGPMGGQMNPMATNPNPMGGQMNPMATNPMGTMGGGHMGGPMNPMGTMGGPKGPFPGQFQQGYGFPQQWQGGPGGPGAGGPGGQGGPGGHGGQGGPGAGGPGLAGSQKMNPGQRGGQWPQGQGQRGGPGFQAQGGQWQGQGPHPGQGQGPHPGQGQGPHPGQGQGPHAGQGQGPHPGQGQGPHMWQGQLGAQGQPLNASQQRQNNNVVKKPPTGATESS